MKKIVVSALLATACVAAFVSTGTTATAKERQAIVLGTAVPIQCTNPGSSQDVAKTPSLINTTGIAIPAGQMLFWKTNGSDPGGSIRLTAALQPGASVMVQGGAGNGYTCTASFARMPDLMPSKVQWQGNSSLAVDVTNTDPWVMADPAVMRVEIMSCSGDVLQKYDSAPVALGKGEKKSLVFPATFVPGKAYLRVTADATKKVMEHSETNNVYDGSGSCIH